MRNLFKIALLLLIPVLSTAQQHYADSLKNILRTAKADSSRYSALNGIGEFYVEINQDSAIRYLNEAYDIAKKNNKSLNEAGALTRKGYVLQHQEKYPESLGCFKEALDLASDPEADGKMWNPNMPWLYLSTPDKNRMSVLAGIHLLYAFLLNATGDPGQYDKQLKLSRKFAITADNVGLEGIINMNLGVDYGEEDRIDSALILEKDAERIARQTGYKKYLSFIDFVLGSIYLKKGNDKLALQYYHRSLTASSQQKDLFADNAYIALAGFYIAKRKPDSSLYYAVKRLHLVRQFHLPELDAAYDDMYRSYQLANNTDSAYKYQGLAQAATKIRDRTVVKNLTDFQKLSMKQQLALQQLEKEKEHTQIRIRTYALLIIIAVVLIALFFIYRNSRQRQKANILLRQQKDELQNALVQLKSTQTQLIQSEKMSSLGELTAGIAHEIQNPLNFVNNFSEVNRELLEELKAESEKPKAERDEQAETELINDLIENEQKIIYHGKRADFIVKGMLQHSRTSTGEKQPTNINILADEFLKLSYHGLRAKDKSFNAEMVTHFDESLPKVNVAQQDIGRVLLNLFNNAFYAVNEKKKAAGTDYKPTVDVSTTVKNGQVEISVKDNGIGIPDAVKEKIMQPFFTTKPTGEGTGLGLSLSYDIVVKGHGGTLDIHSQEGEGAEFIVRLPVV